MMKLFGKLVKNINCTNDLKENTERYYPNRKCDRCGTLVERGVARCPYCNRLVPHPPIRIE